MNMKRFMNKKVVAIGLAAGLTLGGLVRRSPTSPSTGAGNGTATGRHDWQRQSRRRCSTPAPITPGESATMSFTAYERTALATRLNQRST